MYQTLSEKFSCAQEIEEHGTYFEALMHAFERSKEHDMDFVLILENNLPVGKVEDGVIVK